MSSLTNRLTQIILFCCTAEWIILAMSTAELACLKRSIGCVCSVQLSLQTFLASDLVISTLLSTLQTYQRLINRNHYWLLQSYKLSAMLFPSPSSHYEDGLSSFAVNDVEKTFSQKVLCSRYTLSEKSLESLVLDELFYKFKKLFYRWCVYFSVCFPCRFTAYNGVLVYHVS